MKVSEFVEKLNELVQTPTLYGWGKFGNSKRNGKLLFDCSGLIKGILWGYPDNGKYGSNGVADANANTIYSKYCIEKTTNMKDIEVGEFMHMNGHCGIYIGNGEVVESTPLWKDGVQITKLNNRKWTGHGKLVWIDYTSEKTFDYKAIAKEVIRGVYGNGHESRKRLLQQRYGKSLNYEKVRELVNSYYRGEWK